MSRIFAIEVYDKNFCLEIALTRMMAAIFKQYFSAVEKD